MKKILFALTVLALVSPALPRANGDEVSVDVFYNGLSGGNWIEVGDYGYGWQPDVAATDPDWRPYADGYWAYTDYGWTWVSYEDFGWATYHYGRWARLADYGWLWFPGEDLEWGPAWVSWRTGGDQIGWAPLPPRGPGIVYEGRPIGGRVDIEFDIGPAYYNFIDVRFIGEPVLRSHIYAPSYNITYINKTVNVTNITVKNKIVYNYGPDYTVLAAHSSRPIQKLKIERESNVDFSAAAKSGGLKNKVQGDKLVLAAPQTIQRAPKEMAPPTVKTKLTKDKVKLERGWSGVGDARTEADLKQKMKTEDLKKIPPPTSAGAEPPVAGSPARPALGGPGASATPMGTATPPVVGEKGKGRHDEQPGGSPSASEPMNTPSTGTMTTHPGEHKGKEREPLTTPVPVGTPTGGAESTPFRGQYKGKQSTPMPPESVPPTGASEMPQATPFTGKPKGHLGRDVAPNTSEPGGTSGESELRKHQAPQFEGTPIRRGPMNPTEGGAPSEGKMGKHRPEGSNVQPPTGEPPIGAPGVNKGKGKPADEGNRGKGKGKKGEASPAPTP